MEKKQLQNNIEEEIKIEDIQEFFLPWTDNGTTFDDVILLGDNVIIKTLVKRVIEEHKQGERIRAYGLKPTNTILFYGVPGIGKACWNEEQIITPEGLKKIKDIKVGDYIYGKNGKETKVLGVYPQGKKKLYKVILADGRSLICCGEHRFSVGGRSHDRNKFVVMTVNELLEKGLFKKDKVNHCHSKYFIQNNDCIEYKEQNLPIHPYILGAFLGDGCRSTKAFTISSENNEIPNKIATLLSEQLNTPITAKNNGLNYNWVFQYENKPWGNTKNLVHVKDFAGPLTYLFNLYCHEKFIPEEYKYSSYEQRIELVQGLLDTDGSIQKDKGGIGYYSTSKRLLSDLAEVVRSLGNMYVKIHYDRKSLNIGCEAERKIEMFSLNRKKKRAEDSIDYYRIHENKRYYNNLHIIDIQDINLYDDCTCFTVDAEDHQFIAGETVVTHNTYLAKAMHTEMNLPLYILDVAELLKQGNGLERMKKIFSCLRKKGNDKCILFMDECDGIFKSREDPNVAESTKQLTNIIMQNLQEINDDIDSELIIIAASNYRDQLDDATLTRFQVQCNFLLPDDYKEFIELEFKKMKRFNLIDDVADDIMESENQEMKEAKFSIRELQIKIDYTLKTAILEDKMAFGDIIDIKLSSILNTINQHINFGLKVESINKDTEELYE